MPRVRAGASGTVRQLRRLHHTPPTRRAALRFLSRRSSTRLAGPQATAAQRMTVYFAEHDVTLHQGHVADVLPTLPAESVNCVVTSPPYYGLRDYGVDGQIGLEASPAEYVETLRAVFAEVRRVLRPDGTLWLNLGESYSSGRGEMNVGFNERYGKPAG